MAQSSFLESLMGGYQLGSKIKQDRNQSKLAQLASQAYSAPQSDRQGILAQAVGVDPQAGMALGDSLQGVDDQRTKTLVQAARYLTAAPEAARPAIYQQMKPSLAHFGMQLPDQYDDTVAQTAQALVNAYGGVGQSAQLQTFNAMTQGLSPDEVAKARQIALGLQPRAVTGAIKFDTFAGADGRPRPQRNNPTTGGIEIFYDEMGQWVPLGQGQGQQAPAQQQSPGWQQTGPAMFVAEDGQPIPQEDQQALMAAVRQAEATGGEVNVPASQPAQGGALPPRLDYQNGGQRVAGLGVGRSPEEQAALTTAAQERAKLGLLPAQGQIEASNAAAKKEAEMAVTREAEEPQRQEKVRQALRKSENVVQTIDDAINRVGPTTSGFLGSMLDSVPGTAANDLRVTANTIKANLAFDALQAMREASPTGGALGAVSERELALLESAVASIDQSQTPEQLRNALTKVKEHYTNWAQAVRNADQQARARVGGQAPAAASAPQPGTVQDGYRFRGGNPADPSSWERI